jgi:hypothetical protein
VELELILRRQRTLSIPREGAGRRSSDAVGYTLRSRSIPSALVLPWSRFAFEHHRERAVHAMSRDDELVAKVRAVLEACASAGKMIIQ